MTGNAPFTMDDMRKLEEGLAGAAKVLDREIAASGAVDRIAGRVMARVRRRPVHRATWLAVAAALIVAAGLGSLADLTLFGWRTQPTQDVVVLDPLIFGTAVVDQR